MLTCGVCCERFTEPVSLPCGHVFCTECVRRTVEPSEADPSCPTCKATFSILKVDRALVPPYLRPYIHPPLRPLFFGSQAPDAPSTSTSGTARLKPITPALWTAAVSPAQVPSPSPSPATETETESESQVPEDPQTLAELRAACLTWRRRAEAQASANENLLAFARTTRDCALRLRSERDRQRNECVLLRRRLAEMVQMQDGGAAIKGKGVERREVEAGAEKAGAETKAKTETNKRRAWAMPALEPVSTPVFVKQFQPHSVIVEDKVLGPPLKRRRKNSLWEAFGHDKTAAAAAADTQGTDTEIPPHTSDPVG